MIGKNSIVEWTTSSELNNDYFEILRSKDAKIFTSIGQVKGAGNSNEVLNYSIIDDNPYEGISYYKIVQIDFDGKSSSSKLLELNNSIKIEIEIYPNPSKGMIYVKASSNLTIEIYNSSSLLVHKDELQNNISTMDLSNLESGMYILKIKNENGIVYKTLILE